ncbi:MAG: glycosyltransferase [Methanobacteriota archaeon]
MTPPSLVVVAIARNEERTIGACLRSCLESVRRARDAGLLGAAEVLLVDSASTDGTVQVASSLPVRVVSLKAEWPLSAAAGRFVGVRSSRSDLVLFVDGDFVLEPAWLEQALPLLRDPQVAAVCGVVQEAFEGRTAFSRYVDGIARMDTPSTPVAEADVAPIGVYRRTWVEASGGVQPFLKGAEDRDLAMRIRAAGGRLLKTRSLMGYHHWNPGGDLTLGDYMRSVAYWSYGEGQAARHARDLPLVRRAYVRRYANARHLIQVLRGVAVLAWIASVTAFAVLGHMLPAVGSFLAGGVGLVAFAGAGRSVRERLLAWHEVPYVVVRLAGFAVGFLDRPRAANEYPQE